MFLYRGVRSPILNGLRPVNETFCCMFLYRGVRSPILNGLRPVNETFC